MLVQVNYNVSELNSKQEKCLSAGLDLGSTLWVLGLLDRETGHYRNYNFRGPDKSAQCYRKLSIFIKRGYDVHVTYEAGRFGFSPARMIQDLGAKVRVLPVNKLEVVQSGKKVKTDRLDARFLAYLDPFDRLIPSVYIPTIEQECKRGLLREERRLKEEIRRNNDRILSILERWPIFTDKSRHRTSKHWQSELKNWEQMSKIEELLPKTERLQIAKMVRLLGFLESELEQWEDEIKQHVEKQRQACQAKNENFLIDQLQEFRGIGELISRNFAWMLHDFSRFKNGKHFGSVFGLTPTPWISCKKRREQGISKEGLVELRRLAIQGAWLWVKWQPNSSLTKKWQDRLRQKGRIRRMAIVGLSRQLVVALYRYVVHGQEIKGAIKVEPKRPIAMESVLGRNRVA